MGKEAFDPEKFAKRMLGIAVLMFLAFVIILLGILWGTGHG